MDAGAADVGIFADVLEILPEPEDYGMIQPDLPDTVFPGMSIHQLGNSLANPAEGNLAGTKDAGNTLKSRSRSSSRLSARVRKMA